MSAQEKSPDVGGTKMKEATVAVMKAEVKIIDRYYSALVNVLAEEEHTVSDENGEDKAFSLYAMAKAVTSNLSFTLKQLHALLMSDVPTLTVELAGYVKKVMWQLYDLDETIRLSDQCGMTLSPFELRIQEIISDGLYGHFLKIYLLV